MNAFLVPKEVVLNLLREGCTEDKRASRLLALDYVYSDGNKVCVDSKEDLALWSVINNVARESDVAQYLSWRAFERYVRRVFEEIGYDTLHSIRVRIPGTMMEFDVIAYDGDKVVVVECKRWKRAAPSVIKRIAYEHRLKVWRASEYLAKYGNRALPVVITLKGRPAMYDSVVVPVRYLRDLTEHIDEIFYEFEGVVDLQQ